MLTTHKQIILPPPPAPFADRKLRCTKAESCLWPRGQSVDSHTGLSAPLLLVVYHRAQVLHRNVEGFTAKEGIIQDLLCV